MAAPVSRPTRPAASGRLPVAFWLPVAAGLVVLAALWAGPLARASATSFAAHMAVHMGLVTIVAPLVAIGIAGSRYDPTPRHPLLFGPLPASLVELLVVWGWHAPLLHGWARTSGTGYILEQGSFLAAGLLVWIACLGGGARGPRGQSLLGTLGLLLTSIHMTLLGALIAFAGRPLYTHALSGLHGTDIDPLAVIADQQFGGIIMLLMGGAAYLAGGVVLMARMFRQTGETAS
ncbi:cytochrome c oxidase assembly protein [Tistrella sp. BH-R2-4]|jgi:putative membrane protein|uniref:Cytochrome c oxidase assembly protein n=1 Tax=Tistrella arctica TaxID=3133430 RepID=A0ABU9YLW8_9PROT